MFSRVINNRGQANRFIPTAVIFKFCRSGTRKHQKRRALHQLSQTVCGIPKNQTTRPARRSRVPCRILKRLAIQGVHRTQTSQILRGTPGIVTAHPRNCRQHRLQPPDSYHTSSHFGIDLHARVHDNRRAVR